MLTKENKTGSFVELTKYLYFGIHPSIVDPLHDFDAYVLLTEKGKFQDPEVDGDIIPCPVIDRKAPSLKTLDTLVDAVREYLDGKKTVYVACKGGHGRSGTLVSAVLMKMEGISHLKAMEIVCSEWRKQRDMKRIRPKIRQLGAPQTAFQKRRLKEYYDYLLG